MKEYPRIEETAVQITINSNYLLEKGWLVLYGVLMRQADNGPAVKEDVIKTCKRVLEDLT